MGGHAQMGQAIADGLMLGMLPNLHDVFAPPGTSLADKVNIAATAMLNGWGPKPDKYEQIQRDYKETQRLIEFD